jgi:FtsH-binding integral membrane protein
MLNFGLGTGLIVIAFAAQYLLKKRNKNPKMARVLMWVAWVTAIVGGEAMSRQVGNSAGVTSAGAAVASVVMLFFLAVDVADKRPDWPAFFIAIIVPWFMRGTGGTVGQLFDALLAPIQALGTALGNLLGI